MQRPFIKPHYSTNTIMQESSSGGETEYRDGNTKGKVDMMDEDCRETLENVSMTVVGGPLHNSEQMSQAPATMPRVRRPQWRKKVVYFRFEIEVDRGLMANFLVTYGPWRTHLSLSPLG